MSANYKLYYFNIKGAAEPIRLILAYVGVEYEDIRIEKENWPAMKKDTPFGKLPYLEFDGQVLAQSSVICRYLAQKHGLTGKDAMESLRCDEIVASVSDLMAEMRSIPRARDDKEKEEIKQKLFSESVPFYYEKFEKIIASNGGFVVGKQLTWADIYIAYMVDQMAVLMKTDILTKYPAFNALKEKVLAIPAISEWIKKRPQTVM